MRLSEIPSDEEIVAFYNAGTAKPGCQERMYEAAHRKDFLARLQRLLSVILPFAPRVLELGCADGLISQWIAPRVRCLYGIDIAKPCIERCEALELSNATFLLGRLEEHSLGFFDLALAMDVLEHTRDPYRTIGRLRMLSLRILASVPINENPNLDAFSLAAQENPQKIGDGSGHIWCFRQDTFRAVFQEVYHYEDNGITAIILGR